MHVEDIYWEHNKTDATTVSSVSISAYLTNIRQKKPLHSTSNIHVSKHG